VKEHYGWNFSLNLGVRSLASRSEIPNDPAGVLASSLFKKKPHALKVKHAVFNFA
jgi:hypothetical protein